MPWTVSWAVFVDGQNLTDRMRPYLTDITVTDKDGAASDTCSLTFDDTNGQVRLPAEGAAVRVLLQGVQVFEGVVDTVRSEGARGQGRMLNVNAKGFDSRGKVKEPQQFHKDDASLKDFLGQAATNAGYDIEIDPELAGITRDYWAADSESFLHLGQKLARQLSATFKIRGTRAVLAKRGADKGLPTIYGTVGAAFTGNVISWNIAPYTGRRSFTRARVRWFDRDAAAFKTEDVTIETGRPLPEATNLIRTPAADQGAAKDTAEARKREAEREGGEGDVEIDLAVEAQAEGLFVLSGSRPGVDGTYRIVSVTHRAGRSSGSTTKLELKQPQGAAGTDDRESTPGDGGPAGDGAAGADGADGGSTEGGGGDLPEMDRPGDGPE